MKEKRIKKLLRWIEIVSIAPTNADTGTNHAEISKSYMKGDRRGGGEILILFADTK